MEQSLNRGVKNVKAGAKITECVQLFGVGSGFRVLKSSGRTYTAVSRFITLTISVNSIFTKLQGKGRLVLDTGKRNKIIDCICAAPKMMHKAFSSAIIKKSFEDCGMLDVTTNTCPDLYAIINFHLYPGLEDTLSSSTVDNAYADSAR